VSLAGISQGAEDPVVRPVAGKDFASGRDIRTRAKAERLPSSAMRNTSARCQPRRGGCGTEASGGGGEETMMIGRVSHSLLACRAGAGSAMGAVWTGAIAAIAVTGAMQR